MQDKQKEFKSLEGNQRVGMKGLLRMFAKKLGKEVDIGGWSIPKICDYLNEGVLDDATRNLAGGDMSKVCHIRSYTLSCH